MVMHLEVNPGSQVKVCPVQQVGKLFTQVGWQAMKPELEEEDDEINPPDELEEELDDELDELDVVRLGVHVPAISILNPKHLGVGIPFMVMHLLK